jgi:hypothetical protein
MSRWAPSAPMKNPIGLTQRWWRKKRQMTSRLAVSIVQAHNLACWMGLLCDIYIYIIHIRWIIWDISIQLSETAIWREVGSLPLSRSLIFVPREAPHNHSPCDLYDIHLHVMYFTRIDIKWYIHIHRYT